MGHAANRAAAIVGAMRAGLVALPRPGGRIAVTDYGPAEGVGGRDAGGPAGTDRRKNLHRKRDQDYGQKILQPPMHRQTHPWRSNHRQSRKSRSGSCFIFPSGKEISRSGGVFAGANATDSTNLPR